MDELIKPKSIDCESIDGEKLTYIISRFPAVEAREIIQGYLKSAVGNGDYDVSKKLMLKLMGYVAVTTQEGVEIRLTTESLINNHVPDFDVLSKLEHETTEYNSNFFKIGKIIKNLNQFEEKVNQLTTKTSTPSSEQSLAKEKQPFKS